MLTLAVPQRLGWSKTVRSDGASIPDLLTHARARGWSVDSAARQLIGRASQDPEPRHRLHFVSIEGAELGRGIFKDLWVEAARRRYAIPTVAECLVLPASYSFDNLGCHICVLCHRAITLPRVGNPNQVRPYHLELAEEGGGQGTLSIHRVQPRRLMDPSLQYVFVRRDN